MAVPASSVCRCILGPQVAGKQPSYPQISGTCRAAHARLSRQTGLACVLADAECSQAGASGYSGASGPPEQYYSGVAVLAGCINVLAVFRSWGLLLDVFFETNARDGGNIEIGKMARCKMTQNKCQCEAKRNLFREQNGHQMDTSVSRSKVENRRIKLITVNAVRMLFTKRKIENRNP